jgi:putative restriction endonuclease
VDHSAGDLDRRVRLAAFDFLTRQTQRTPDGVLPRTLLATGFSFNGTRVPLIGPQGIFKPAILPEMPLSIATIPIVEGRPRPYEDGVGPGGLLLYRYRGSDPSHRDNVGLRLAMRRQVPLIYLFGVVPGQYLPVWPVYIVADDPARLAFSVAVDDAQHATVAQEMAAEPSVEARRQYLTTLTQRRLHQESFRQRVLQAYQTQCAICRLRHTELLEAAHILPDGHPKGEPIVPNGLALCKLHHAAFDQHILGVRPDLIVEVRLDILHEVDGPMLKYGLQEMQGNKIVVPPRGSPATQAGVPGGAVCAVQAGGLMHFEDLRVFASERIVCRSPALP